MLLEAWSCCGAAARVCSEHSYFNEAAGMVPGLCIMIHAPKAPAIRVRPIGIDAAHVAPVGRHLGYPLDERKSGDPGPLEHARENLAAQVVGGAPLGVFPQHLPQDSEAQQVNPP